MYFSWKKFLSAGVLLAVSLPATAQVDAPVVFAPVCESRVSDADGDGWGWENNRTCVVSDAESSGVPKPVCRIGTMDFDGDGYGYQAGVSCLIVQPSRSCVRDSSDPDGDGYGFENGRSCVVNGTNLSTPSPMAEERAGNPQVSTVVVNGRARPVCITAATDPDGDGWGYENGESCITEIRPELTIQEPTIPDSVLPRTPEVDNEPPVAMAAHSGLGTDDSDPLTLNHTVCASSLSDTDGDGFGFEGGRSCMVTGTSRPVPVCLSILSDLGGSGYGFERGETCIAVEGVSADSENLLLSEALCENWVQIAYGNYRIQNNTWNSGVMYDDRWMQCIELNLEQGRPVASWSFDWLTPQDGDLDQVKSYPQVFYGRKEANEISAPKEVIGMPELVSNLPEYKVDYRWSVSGDAEHNVALESFFHTTCEANHNNKEYEMMVWVGIPETKTPGVLVTNATIDGKRWRVYANPALSWGYVAFVAENDSFSGTLDWSRFIEWSQENSSIYGLGELRTGSCMGAIEIGTETFWGKGEFTLHQFDVRRDR